MADTVRPGAECDAVVSETARPPRGATGLCMGGLGTFDGLAGDIAGRHLAGDAP